MTDAYDPHHKISLISLEKTPSFSSITNINIQINPQVTLFTILLSMYLIIAILLRLMISLNNSKTSFFDYMFPNMVDTNLNVVLYIFQCILIFINLILIFSLLRKREKMLITFIHSYFRWLFVCVQFLIGTWFILGTINGLEMLTLITSNVISLSAILTMMCYYKDIVKKKNMHLATFICLYAYTSAGFSFFCYITMYNLRDFILKCILVDRLETSKQIFSLVINCIQFLIGLVLLAHHKDVFFTLTNGMIYLGLFLKLEYTPHYSHLDVIVLFFAVVLSVFITTCKYGKKAFGFEDEEMVKK